MQESTTDSGGETRTRAGMVSVLGEPNAGKSTLVNAVVGAKVSIVSPKPQTTWYPVRGIVNRPAGQIVLVDTPGFVSAQPKRIPVAIRSALKQSIAGIEAVLRVIDAAEPPRPEEAAPLHRLLEKVEAPVIPVLAKMDAATAESAARAREIAGGGRSDVVETSAATGDGLERLVETILGVLPESKPLYPADLRTDLPVDTWIGELIRERIFEGMEQELPYTALVRVEEMAERPNGILYIEARILVAEQRQRGMFIGVGGRKIRELGSAARKEIERALDREVYLDLTVKERRR